MKPSEWKGLEVPPAAVERIVARGLKSLRGVRKLWATEWRRWARRWEDRSAAEARAEARAAGAAWAVRAAAAAAAWEAEAWAAWAASRAAREAELGLQARDIRRELPSWNGRRTMKPSDWISTARLNGRKPCRKAVEWLESYETASAWKVCPRGDWMIWALRAEGISIPKVAIERIVERAIERGVRAICGVREPWAADWRRWAKRWISGEDRSAEAAARAARAAWAAEAAWAAREAAWAAARAAAAAAELRLQARDTRRELPEWPGGTK